MQICQLTGADADGVEHSGLMPDCRLHRHLSKRDANQLAAAGKVRFVNSRAVVAADSAPLSWYWYDKAVEKDDRYLGTAKSGTPQSGWVNTGQLLNFMPRAMEHTVKVRARRRRMSVAAINRQRESFAEAGE